MLLTYEKCYYLAKNDVIVSVYIGPHHCSLIQSNVHIS